MPQAVTQNEAVGSDGSVDDTTRVPKCFVMQPFDEGGKFDKRYRDAFEPALRAAGLRAYRVDEDPEVDVPIEAIEDGIRRALIVLADVTEHNPNVWYELGFAYAANKPVILTCCEDENHSLPFDIRHRKVLFYQSQSPSDFDTLKMRITARALVLRKAALEKEQVENADPIPPRDALSQREIDLLRLVARETAAPGTRVPVHMLSHDAAKSAGLKEVAFGLAFRELTHRGFVKIEEIVSDYKDDVYDGAYVDVQGWNWIGKHDHLFIPKDDVDEFDEIPF